ncbi:MAG: choice-of-anchor D domain-containing protein [Labedaea sp.]
MPKFSVRRPLAMTAATAMVATTAVSLLVSSTVVAPSAGAAIAPGSTVRASVHDGTNQAGTSDSFGNVISADGRSVAFTSFNQLDNLSTNGNQSVFVRDLVRNRTVMISRGQFIVDTGPTIGAAPPTPPIRFGGDKLLDLGATAARAAQPAPPQEFPPDNSSSEPTISADGRYVAFVTFAQNIVPEDDGGGTSPNEAYVIVCDRDPNDDGVFDENLADGSKDFNYFAVNRTTTNTISHPRLSADASRIVWQDENSGQDHPSVVWIANLGTPAAKPIAGSLEQLQPNLGNAGRVRNPRNPAISGDGNHVVADVDFSPNCECDDTQAIVSVDLSLKQQTTRVDIEGGQPISDRPGIFVQRPAVNVDGSVIAFEAEVYQRGGSGSDRFSFFSIGIPNVYVVTVDYSRQQNQRVTDSTIASRGTQSDIVNGTHPALSSDGRYVAFTTDALNTHDGVDQRTISRSCINPNDDIGLRGEQPLRLNAAVAPPTRDNPARTSCQIVVRDLDVLRTTLRAEGSLPGTLASPGLTRNCTKPEPAPDATCAGNEDSDNPSLSADGSKIGFDSNANDLVPGDSSGEGAQEDVFVRTLEPALRGTTVDFGPVQLGDNLVRTAQIEEIGNGPVFIDQVALAGTNAADFTISGQTCQGQTLRQNTTCGVSVQFTPRATGDRRGQLQIRVRGGRIFTVDLAGSGTEKPVPPRGPEFSPNPSPLDFGQRLLLSDGPESTVTVTNGGQTALQISAVTPVGPGAPGDYKISANTCLNVAIAANASCRVSVKFSPTLPGDRSATLQFTHNAPGGTTLVGLRGQSGTPILEVNPGVTAPSRVVTVIGKGYPPNKKVNVTFAGAVGGTVATTGADGTFRASLLIFPKTKPEQRTVVGTVDGAPALFANVPLLIVIASVSPADFVVRG